MSIKSDYVLEELLRRDREEEGEKITKANYGANSGNYKTRSLMGGVYQDGSNKCQSYATDNETTKNYSTKSNAQYKKDYILEELNKREKLYDEQHKEQSEATNHQGKKQEIKPISAVADKTATASGKKLKFKEVHEYDKEINNIDNKMKKVRDTERKLRATINHNSRANYSTKEDRKKLKNITKQYKELDTSIRALKNERKVLKSNNQINSDLKAIKDNGWENDISTLVRAQYKGEGYKGLGPIERIKLSYEQRDLKVDLDKEMKKKGYNDNQIQGFFDTYKRIITNEMVQENALKASEKAKEHPVWESAKTVLHNIPNALSFGMGSAAETIYNKTLDRDVILDPNAVYNQQMLDDQVTRQTIGQELHKEKLGGTKSFLYQTGMSMADFVSLLPLGEKAVLSVMGTNAAAAATNDAINRGASTEQALQTGFMAGSAEVVFERISLGNLRAFKDMPAKSAKQILNNMVKQSVVEASEEVATDITNTIFDAAINGDNASLELKKQAYIKKGMSNEEAERKVMSEFAKDTAMSAAGGLLSGFVMGGGANVVGNIQTGHNIKKSTSRYDMVEQGLQAQPNTRENIISNEILNNKYKKSKDASIFKYGELVAARQENQINNTKQETFDNMTSVNKATKKIISKVIEGENINVVEAKALTKNDEALKVLSDITETNLQGLNSVQLKKTINQSSVMHSYNSQQAETQDIAEQESKFTPMNENLSQVNAVSNKVVSKGAFLNGQNVKVDKVISVKDGKAKVQIVDGKDQVKTVDSKTLKFKTKNIETLYNNSYKYTPEGANVYLSNYDGSMSLSEYTRNFNAFYDMGKSGVKFEQLVQEYPSVVKTFGKNRARAVVNVANQSYRAKITQDEQAVRNKENVKSTTEGGVVQTHDYKLDDVGQAQMNVLDAVGKKYNVLFHISEDVSEDANGMYVDGSNIIELNVDAQQDAYLVHAGHELVHYIKDHNAKDYEELEKFVMKTIADTGKRDVDSLISRKVKLYQEHGVEISRKEAVEEIVADSCFDVLSNEDVINKLANENKSLLERISDFLKNFIQELKSIKDNLTKEEAKILKDNTKALDEINRLFFKALDGVNKNTDTNSDGRVKYSINPKFEKEYDKWDKKTKGFPFNIGTTSEVLQELGVDDKKIYWHASKILKIKEKHKAMTDDVIKQVPNILENPILVMGSKTNTGRLTLFGEVYDKNNAPVLAVLELNPTDNQGTYVNLIVVASAYGKDGNLQKFINSSDLLYVEPNIKRTHNWLSINRLQLPLHITNYGFINTNISQKKNGVNDSIFINDEEMHKIKYSINDSFDKQVDDVIANKIPQNTHLCLGDTPSELTELGIIDKPILVTQNHIYSMTVSEEKAKADGRYNKDIHYHDLGVDVVKQLPEAISKPVAIVKSNKDKNNTDIVLITELINKNNSPIIAAIKIDGFGRCNGKFIRANIMLSAYGKDTFNDYIDNALKWDRILKFNKKRSQSLRVIPGVQFPNDIDNFNFNNNLTQYREVVNKHYMQKSQNNNKEKFSLKDDETTVNDAKELMRKYKKLNETVEMLRSEFKLTKGHKLNKASVDKIASKYIKEYDSTLDKNELSEKLYNTFTSIANADSLSWDNVYGDVYDVAKSIVESSSSLDKEVSERYHELKSKIRDTEIKLSDSAKNELTYYYGSYNNFRKSNFGKLKLSNNGIDVDTLYQELCNDYPEFFEDGIAEQDQIIRISEVYDSLQPVYVNEYGGNIDNVAMFLALHLHEDYLNVPEVRTFADKKQEQYNDMQNKYRTKIKELKADMKDKHDNEIQRLKDKNKELRLDKNKKILEQRAMYQEKIVKTKSHAKERKGIDYYRPRVEKNIKKLSKWLFNGDDSHNVPEKFRKSIAVALQMVDTSSIDDNNTKRSIDFAELVSACNLLVEDEIDVDPDLITEVLELKEISQGKKMLDMSASELEQLNEIIKRIMHTCVNANKLLANERYENISAMANDMFEDFKKRKTVKAKTQTVEKINNLVTYDTMDTVRYFDRIGEEVGNTLWRELRNGLDKKIVNTKTTEEYVKNNKGNLNISKLTGTNAKVHEFNLENGSSIKLTTAQIMGLYELNKREQAREHIYGSGILQGVTVTGKINKKVTKSYEAVKVTPQDVQDMISKLSNKEVEFADKLAEFMNTTAAEWGNDVSLQMYGYKKFTEQNYYPIKCDDNSTNSDVSDNKNPLFTLKNLGFTKQTKRHANNPVVIEDIFDVFTQHTNNMATYNAFVVPLTDLTKFYNFKSRDEEGMIQSTVKQELERVLGKDGKVYYYNLLKSINQTAQDHIGEQLSRKMLANFKAAAVGGNLRVAVQQPMSIARAFNMLNPLDFGKIKFRKDLEDIMQKYAPIVTWKDYGFFELDTAKSMKNIILDKHTFREASMWLIGKGDTFAWKVMWNACENEVARTTELKSGTEEFYKKVGERFSDVIDRTQVVDSVLHRTQITRSDNMFVKVSTSFMAEPLKTYNILSQAAYDVVKRPSAKSNEKFIRATICFITNAVLVSASASLISAVRDDDEDKTYLEKYLNAMFGVDKEETDPIQRIKNMAFSEIGSNINPLNMIPYVKDFLSLLEGYDIKRVDMEGLTQIVKASTQWINKMSDPNYKYSDMYIIKNAIKGLSTFAGLPVYNIYRTVENGFKVCVDFANKLGVDVSDIQYTLSKSKYEVASTKNNSYYGKKMLKAKLEGNNELAEKIANEMAESGISKTKLENAYNSAKKKYLDSNEIIIKAAKDRINGNNKAYAEAVNELKGDVFSQDDIIKAINRTISSLKKGEDVQNTDYYSVDDLFKVSQENKEKLHKSTYSYTELNKGIENNNYKNILEDMLQAYKDNGETDSKAKSRIRSQVTKHFKSIYINSNSYEKREIIDTLYETGLYGSYDEAREDIEKWDEKEKFNPDAWID